MVRTRSGRLSQTPNSGKTLKPELLRDDIHIPKPSEGVDSIYATFLQERVYERKRSLTNAEADINTHSALVTQETFKPQLDKISPHDVEAPNNLAMDTAYMTLTKRKDINVSNGNAQDELVSKSHHQESRSFLTEIAQKLHDDDLSEVDSVRGDINLISVCGYTVKPEHANLLTSILSKHGDIAANCTLKLDTIRSFFIQYVCDAVHKLRSMSIGLISETELNDMLCHLNEFEVACVEVGWLKKRVYEILEAKKAIPMLRSSSELKQVHAERKAKIQKKKARLEACKNDIAIREAEIQLLKEMFNSISIELAADEEEAAKTDKMIKEYKAKLRHIVELDSLDHGLL